jgi:hypothetical protein
MIYDFRKQLETFGGTPAVMGALEAFGDPTRWREIADLNKLNVLKTPDFAQLELPGKDELSLQAQAQPLLTSVANGLNGAGQIASKISPQLGGYVAEAQRLLGQVNGVLGKAESVYNKAQQIAKTRDYKEAIKLVDWLL